MVRPTPGEFKKRVGFGFRPDGGEKKILAGVVSTTGDVSFTDSSNKHL